MPFKMDQELQELLQEFFATHAASGPRSQPHFPDLQIGPCRYIARSQSRLSLSLLRACRLFWPQPLSCCLLYPSQRIGILGSRSIAASPRVGQTSATPGCATIHRDPMRFVKPARPSPTGGARRRDEFKCECSPGLGGASRSSLRHRGPHGKSHLVLTCGTLVDANICVTSLGK